MTSLQELQRNWEGYAQADPFWSICTDPEKRNKKWDEREFFETGTREIAKILGYVRSCGLRPTGPALDFGCGVGRLTQALSEHFEECWGVDISPTMIDLAKRFHVDNPRCRFLVNATDNLQTFSDDYFGFAYTSIVLQHIKRRFVEHYVQDLIRVLKPGGIFIFQVPDRDASGIVRRVRNKLRLRGRIRRFVLRQAVFNIEMHCISEKHVRKLLHTSNAELIDVKLTNSTDMAFIGNLQFLDREPEDGFISKQYCAVKNRIPIQEARPAMSSTRRWGTRGAH